MFETLQDPLNAKIDECVAIFPVILSNIQKFLLKITGYFIVLHCYEIFKSSLLPGCHVLFMNLFIAVLPIFKVNTVIS